MTTIPRGMAMAPLTPSDINDFLYNYFKAEYAPIRSFFSTATAEPRHPQRWSAMGTELSPSVFRPANAQAQKDLESLDDFLRKHALDATFVRGLVVRYARFEVHERLEKKLFESCREDLMVRKALKEKHVIDSIWPAGAKYPVDHAQQGQKVRAWYGDMFGKYFRYLHTLEDYKLRPEVEDRIRMVSQLNLVPFVDHLVFGPVEPILPMAAKGVVQPKSFAKDTFVPSEGRPDARADRFDIRFDAPPYLSETQTRSVVRTTDCLKCGTKRDVTVVISIDPPPGPVEKRHQHTQSLGVLSNTSAPLARRDMSSSKAAAKSNPDVPREEKNASRDPSSQHQTHSTALEAQSIPSDDAKPATAPTTSQTEKPPSIPAQDTARPPTARNSLSLNLLNLNWPRSFASTPTQATTTAPPTLPERNSPPNPEMVQRAPSPPPTYSRKPSPHPLNPSTPPASTSLLDSTIPLSSPLGVEDDAAAEWGEMESAPATESDSEDERRRERERARSPVMLELEGERNVWGDD